MADNLPNGECSGSPRGRAVGLIAGGLLFLVILLFVELDAAQPGVTRTAACAALIAVFWVSEALPIPVTSLLPLVLFPALNIMKGSAVAAQYMNSTIFLFLGGFLVALGIERWRLHRRLALTILLFIGERPDRLALGIMSATALISMWVSNTATAMMMFPIALAVIGHADRLLKDDRQRANFALTLMLSVAYGASIGGIGTLVGSPPNIVFVRIFSISFPEAPSVTFTQWFLFAIPFIIVFLFTTWLLLTRVLVPVSRTPLAGGRELLLAELRQMGRMSRAEKRITAVFILTAALWITRGSLDFGFVKLTGWADALGLGQTIDDGTVAVAMAVLLFLLPSGLQRGERLLDWKTAMNIPWEILLLFGGGFALAEAFQQSGLSIWVGKQLSGLTSLPPIVMVAVIAFLMTFLTELTSNTAITQLLLPVFAAMAVAGHIHPLLLMIPATISASCAFMMPAGTPPNAIVFSSGRVPIIKMAKAGFFLNIVGVILVTLLVMFLVNPMFSLLRTLPGWVK